MTQQLRHATCRVAVLDDQSDELERIVAAIKAAASAEDEIDVEGYTRAGDVIQKIEAARDGKPPWDIVLADVLMPTVADGAFAVAEAIERRYGHDAPVKLAAITSVPGAATASRYLRKFDTKENAGWFVFFVKGRMPGHPASSQLLDDDTWRFALRHLLVFWRTDLWGWAPIRRLDQDTLSQSIFYSARAHKLLTDAIDIGQNRNILCVHLSGESGAGKEVVAHVLHAYRTATLGKRGDLVPVNCGTVNGDLAASTLFGYYKGAFTGAVSTSSGPFEDARDGTIFLDELQDLSLADQAKLLRIIEERKIPKLDYSDAPGSQKPRPEFTGVLLVTASSQPIARLLDEGRLDPALAYRIRMVTLDVPPLRERRDDIIPSAMFFLRMVVAGRRDNEGKTPSIDRSGQAWLLDPAHMWPGNFRTLRTLVFEASSYGRRVVLNRENFEEAAKKEPAFAASPSDWQPSDVQVAPPAMARVQPPRRSVRSLTREEIRAMLERGDITNQMALIRGLIPGLTDDQVKNLKRPMKAWLDELARDDDAFAELVARVLSAGPGRPPG
jgi:transcriptional regulator with AAA-type ATPase domain